MAAVQFIKAQLYGGGGAALLLVKNRVCQLGAEFGLLGLEGLYLRRQLFQLAPLLVCEFSARLRLLGILTGWLGGG